MLTYEYLVTRLEYNKETGIFIWLTTKSNKIKIGDIAGSLQHEGYHRVSIDKKEYLSHRLAWFYIYKEWPKGQIDHINGIKNDNRIKNLRDVSHSINGQNQTKHRNGHLVGTTWCKRDKKWIAYIYINRKRKHIGVFLSQQEAHEAYLLKRMELGL